MKEQPEAAKDVAINMEIIEGPHYEDLVDESSNPRSNIEIQRKKPKKPKVQEKNDGSEPISHNNERPPNLPPELHFLLNNDESSITRSNQQQEGCKISMGPEMLRIVQKDKDSFYPCVVSIGPYHHGNRHLKKFKKLKTKLAWQYCKTRDVIDLYKSVKGVSKDAREYYDVKRLKGIEEEAFTIMMFLDGCFILEFITWLLCVKKEHYDIGMNNNEIANVKRDLFLLENQLPYKVLEALMEGDDKKEGKKRIKSFITMCQRLPLTVKPWMYDATSYFSRSPPKQESQTPHHLLDMMRTTFVKQSATFPSRMPAMILSLLDKVLDHNPSATSDWYSYHSARVLKSMGIWFRPNKTGSFSDVRFESQLFFRGMLTLPPILIDASTKSLLLNMLAFESSYTNLESKQAVTSYMCFMDSLIDNADDVMILRSQNVIVNCLGTDQDVANLFNDIASNLAPNPRTYVEAKLGIQKHCNNKLKKWMAECFHTHFRSPWTLLALCGAILVILLTAAQTFLAAWQLKN